MAKTNGMTTWFYILTVAVPHGGGMKQNTSIGTVDLPTGTPRAEVYEWVDKNAPSEYQGANVLFYSAEPNRTA